MDMTSAIEQIKKVLKKWTDHDAVVSNARCCADKTCISSAGICEYPVSINGLVGHLSGNMDGNKWNDEYLCVNATIKGNAGKGSNGLIFMGVGSGAVWPVSTNGPARQYYFANNAFTLAALVTIHAVPKKSSPLLGVRLKNSKHTLLGVSYNEDKTWSTIDKGNEGKAKTPKWEGDKEYSVILTFENGKDSVYINGIRLDVGTKLRITEGEESSHFYFGVDSEDESPLTTTESKPSAEITVKDVMLYNRVLSNEELDVFLKNKLITNFPQQAETKISEQTTAAASSPAPATKSTTISEKATTTQEATTPITTVTVPAFEPKSAPKSASQPVIPLPAYAEIISQTAEPAVSQRTQNQVKKEEIVPPNTNVQSEKKEIQQIPKKSVLVEE
ncbi:hypothetical protein LSM04_005413 [Trypanosoma melophagium]|uniref:uncharacterized protein n=1 Tax=Trypanosoma melophagium TaxID=715481 RepID=UPI00351A13DC|nr:hypothetical protein LSM04_005413 [Trypanosoma melophagium]